VDVDPHKLELACRLGADESLRGDEVDVTAEILKRTNGRGTDLVVEVVGITATVKTAVACVRKGGKLALVGNLSPEVDFPLQAVVTREISLVGSCASCGEYPACLDLMARGAVNVEPLISATAPLDEGATWFRRLYDSEEGLMKIILKP
jgi:L-iditol 2-dehydrogenase